MTIDDLTISRAIINSYMKKLLGSLQLDVALVGAGPSNLVAGYYLAKQGLKAAIFESKLAPGGGIWGGGMMFNEIVVPDDALAIVEEVGIRFQPAGDGHYTMDSVEMAATLISKCVQSGTVIFNLIKATDVLFREENGQPRVSGLVISWSPVESLDLHIDPLGIKASFVVDGTGHPAEICRIVIRKMGVKLNTRTGDVVGEMPLWAERGEQFTVSNTGEVFPGLYVAGMASNNVFGGPRMGPIFGGMLLSGKKIAELIFREANGGS
jgi:sulfide-dependent adenosine diphosphate thiazole synthase